MASAAALRLHLPRPTSPLILSAIPKLSNFLPFSSFPLSPSPLPLLSPHRPRCYSSTPTPTPSPTPPSLPQLRQDLQDDENSESDSPSEPELGIQEEAEVAAAPLPDLPSPKLTVREKKDLAAYAHSLGKKLKSQQVGKSGVTLSVATSFVESLESNELLKLKIHGNCPGELIDVISQLEKSTGSVAVAQIGRTVILYRPSLSKIKKKEAQSATSKRWKAKSTELAETFAMQKKRPVTRVVDHGNNPYCHT